MRITVFGAGYVGLVSATCFAEWGNDVSCVDIDASKINALQQGHSPIYEPGLEQLLQKNLNAKRLTFTTDREKALHQAEYVVIAVGTPSNDEGAADLSYVLNVAALIGETISTSATIITKSTVPVGTNDKIKSIIQNKLALRHKKFDCHIVSNPEFLREGAAIDDFMHPCRVVIGAETQQAFKAMDLLYTPLNQTENKMLYMDLHSAELSKYAANAFLATKISFINEISQLCERLGANVESIRQALGKDPRIGNLFLFPGCGYGGSCFPKDVRALKQTAIETNYLPLILMAVEEVNKNQKQLLFNKLSKYFNNHLKDKIIAVWGLAFKPDTDDMREAPSRDLMEALWSAGARVQAYDPVAMNEAKRIYGARNDFLLGNSKEAVLEGADVLVIMTEWTTFRAPDFALIKQKLKYPIIFDGRNILNIQDAHKNGLFYIGVGIGDALEKLVIVQPDKAIQEN